MTVNSGEVPNFHPPLHLFPLVAPPPVVLLPPPLLVFVLWWALVKLQSALSLLFPHCEESYRYAFHGF